MRYLLLGDRRIVPLAIAHGLGGSADAFVSISLAGSLFFNVSPDASRKQVLLYLLVTLAPLAVLAPLVGPAVERFRRSQRFVASILNLLRALSCIALVSFLLDLIFYPRALVLLVASKASGIMKQTLVPSLIDDPDELVATNARLASITAAVGAGVAVAVLQVGGSAWTLRGGAVLFALTSAVVLRVRSPQHVTVATDDIEYAETHLDRLARCRSEIHHRRFHITVLTEHRFTLLDLPPDDRHIGSLEANRAALWRRVRCASRYGALNPMPATRPG
jgi:hypothetical protein